MDVRILPENLLFVRAVRFCFQNHIPEYVEVNQSQPKSGILHWGGILSDVTEGLVS